MSTTLNTGNSAGSCIRTTLRNGNRLLVLPDERMAKVGVAFVMPGARYETTPYIAHPTEHVMADRDTYPSYEQYASAVDSRTRGFNAEIGRETTVLSFGANPSGLEELAIFAKRIIIQRKFPERLVRQEMHRLIVEEMLDDDTVEMIDDFENETVFAGHELARRLFGSREEMATLDVDDIRQWHRRMVRSPMTIAVVGQVDPISVQRIIQRQFGRFTVAGELPWQRFRSSQRRLRLRLMPWPTQLVHIALAILVPFGLGDPRRVVLSALNNHLGERSRWSSRLQIRFIGKEKLVYGIGSKAWNYREVGTLSITTQCEVAHVEPVLRGVIEELVRLRDQPLTAQEFELMRKSLIELSEDRTNDPVRYATFLGEQATIAGSPVTHGEFLSKVEQLSPSSIQHLAKALIRRARMGVILVGPVGKLSRERLYRTLALP